MKRILFALLFAAIPVALAGGWKPFQFKPPERYEYKMVSSASGEEQTSGFVLELKDSGQKEGEDPLYEVTYATTSRIARSKLMEGGMMGQWGAGLGMWGILYANPMLFGAFSDLDLAVGEKMGMMGMGTMKVTAKETVGGREGFVCQWFEPEKKVASWEWVVDPALALPIRVRQMEEEKIVQEIALVSYTGS